MTKKLTTLISAAFLLGITQVKAQNSELDILRYSELSPWTTARSIGLGGAGGSYGADFSNLSINPAGIGVYRHSKVMITPTLRINNAKSSFLGNTARDNNSKFNFSNLGVVFAHAKQGEQYDKSAWKSWSIAIGYNRLADFNEHVTYSGRNSQSSLTDVMSNDALNFGTDDNIVPPLGYLGYQGYLLYDDLSSIPRNNILNQGGDLIQTKSWESSGGIDDWTLSFGGNLEEKLMLGMSLDLLDYHFKRDSYFEELDGTGNPNNDFASLDYHQYLNTTGIGFNMKLGAIYIPAKAIRIGVAVHTPTWASFSDASDYDISTNTENLKARTGQPNTDPNTFVQPSQPFAFNYNIRTPWQALLSATVFLGDHGFITADYSYVDYTSMKYSFDRSFNQEEHSVNQAINQTYQAGHNFRVGIEGKAKQFSGRLGYAYHTNPFKPSIGFDGSGMDFSAGLGLRIEAFTLDLGYLHTIQKSSDLAYPIVVPGIFTPQANIKQNNNLVALTFGYQF